MSTRDDPGEQLLDLLVYAPLGLLLEARDLVPKLAEKGRQRMGGQVTVARMIGEVAVRQGQRRAETVVKRLRDQQTGAGAGARAGRPEPDVAQPADGHRPPFRGPAPASTPANPDAAGLAIPGYDTLSASQVVPRLEGLSPGELEAVRAYEVATRGRKTVLTRIDQLRGA
ncbi:MAG TPA: hypothetical protein VM388_07395 [Acidimicrobiales bacterium]|nr:hypothetical protein [Acidimicrobiales bacterium]